MRSHLSQDPCNQPHKTITMKKGEERAVLGCEGDQKCCPLALYLHISLAIFYLFFYHSVSQRVCPLNRYKPPSQMDLQRRVWSPGRQ